MSHLELPQEPTQGDSIDLLGAVVRFYRSALRRKKIVISCVLMTSTLAAVYFVTATRLYQSRAELIVLSTGGDVVDHEGRSKSSVAAQMPNFERVLQSDRVLKQALIRLPEEHRLDFHEVTADRWLEHFRSRMSVSTLRNTNVMSVSFRSVSPETAYIVVDALIDSYLRFMNSMHQDTTQDQLRILLDEKSKAEHELREKEQHLLTLKRESQVLFGTDEQPTNILTARVIELNNAYIEAKKQTMSAKAMWIEIERAVENGEDLQEFAIRMSESLGTKLLETVVGVGGDSSYIVSQMQRDLLEARSELNVKRETLGENHPAVKQLQERIRAAEGWLESRPARMSEAMADVSQRELGPRLANIAARQYQVALAQEKEIFSQYLEERDAALEIGQQLAQVELLQNEVQNLRTHYSYLLESIKAKSLAKESGISAKPITPPSIDHRPVTPKLSLTCLMALASGLTLGGLGVYILDFFDDRFHSPDDLRLTLGTQILAMVRRLAPLADSGLQSLYPFARPNSLESEAFRTLRTAIDFAPEEMRRLTISSTEPSDGKTTIVASLGVAYAQAGKRTLLIDGDMRRPGATRLFDLVSKPGLSTILRDSESIEKSAPNRIVKTHLEKLHVLPAGPRPVNPVELLAGERLSELISWAEGHYDQILIDAPPSLAVADVQVIGRVVDAAVLVVRPDRNRRKMVIRAAESLTALGCQLLGVVVNHVDSKNGGDYGYGYGYGYSYGDGYGHDEAQEAHEASLRAAA